EVWARPYRRPPCKHCLSPDLRIKATHKRTVKHTRQGNQVVTLHFRCPNTIARPAGATSAIPLLASGHAIAHKGILRFTTNSPRSGLKRLDFRRP
ncbi:MAG: hypothetical protein ACRCVD_15475, partial [Halioglobus sp.]